MWDRDRKGPSIEVAVCVQVPEGNRYANDDSRANNALETGGLAPVQIVGGLRDDLIRLLAMRLAGLGPFADGRAVGRRHVLKRDKCGMSVQCYLPPLLMSPG